MVTSAYEWSAEARRWRSRSTGRFAAERTITGWRNTARKASERAATEITESLARGDITIQRWERVMQKIIRDAHTSDYLLARGGRHSLTPADRKILGRELEKQYDHLRTFARQIVNEEVSEAAASARARMYPRSANASFNMAREAAWGVDLPGYPGVGTECLSNCRCVWVITTRKNEVIASYKVAPGDACTTCMDRGRQWAELTFTR